MPRIIRQALAERLLQSPRAAAFLRDFSSSTGLPLRFATPLGSELPVAGAWPAPPPCLWMRSEAGRARLCARTVQEGAMVAEAQGGCGAVCAAGLREAAVPLRLGGELYGYLLVGQVAARPLDRTSLNRWRHELERAGQAVEPETLANLAASVDVYPEERFAAALRLLEWSAGQLAEHMESQLTQPGEALSPPVRKACSLIRSRYSESLSLGAVAAAVGLSREHFCTLFHKGTGLRFVDYLTRVRVERAGELLRSSDKPVLNVALACGFQSISHFNRRFRTATGQTPTAYRAAERNQT